MIISLHIPKTAGTTFRTYLDAVFPGDVLLDYPRTTADLIRRFRDYAAKADPVAAKSEFKLPRSPEGMARFRQLLDADHVRVIHGHFRRGKYSMIYPDGDYITWVREPLARACSHFLFHRCTISSPDDQENVLIHAGKLSFQEWIEKPAHINQQYNFTGDGALEKFKFIGLVEEFDASIAAFNRIFGISGASVPAARLNANPDKDTSSVLDPATETRFKALNAADYDLYRRVWERYHPLKTDSCKNIMG